MFPSIRAIYQSRCSILYELQSVQFAVGEVGQQGATIIQTRHDEGLDGSLTGRCWKILSDSSYIAEMEVARFNDVADLLVHAEVLVEGDPQISDGSRGLDENVTHEQTVHVAEGSEVMAWLYVYHLCLVLV